MFKYNLSPDISIKLTKLLCKWWLEGWVEAGEESRKLPSSFPWQPQGFQGTGSEKHVRGPGEGVCGSGAGTQPRLGAQGPGPAWEQTSDAENRPALNVPPETRPLTPNTMPTPPALLRRCSARDSAQRTFACTLKPSRSECSQGFLCSLGVCSTTLETSPWIRPRGCVGSREEPSISARPAHGGRQPPSSSVFRLPQPRGTHAPTSIA